jgi:protocatechuate 3,4-dioxygenase beta subunit
MHFRVLKRGYHELITQMYFAGEEHNETDRILLSLPKADQEHAIVQFVTSGAGTEPIGTFDLNIKAV